MSDDPEWDKIGANINAVTDRMVIAGWVKETMRNLEGIEIEYTPDGLKKMYELWKLLAEIDFASMDDDALRAFRAVLGLFARRKGLL